MTIDGANKLVTFLFARGFSAGGHLALAYAETLVGDTTRRPLRVTAVFGVRVHPTTDQFQVRVLKHTLDGGDGKDDLHGAGAISHTPSTRTPPQGPWCMRFGQPARGGSVTTCTAPAWQAAPTAGVRRTNGFAGPRLRW